MPVDPFEQAQGAGGYLNLLCYAMPQWHGAVLVPSCRVCAYREVAHVDGPSSDLSSELSSDLSSELSSDLVISFPHDDADGAIQPFVGLSGLLDMVESSNPELLDWLSPSL